jgi:hypothetical protein
MTDLYKGLLRGISYLERHGSNTESHDIYVYDDTHVSKTVEFDLGWVIDKLIGTSSSGMVLVFYIETWVHGLQLWQTAVRTSVIVSHASTSAYSFRLYMKVGSTLFDQTINFLVEDVKYMRIKMSWNESDKKGTVFTSVYDDPYAGTLEKSGSIVNKSNPLINASRSRFRMWIEEDRASLSSTGFIGGNFGPVDLHITDTYSYSDPTDDVFMFDGLYDISESFSEDSYYRPSRYSGNQLRAMDYKFEITNLQDQLVSANEMITSLEGQINDLNDISKSDVGGEVDSSLVSAAWNILVNNPVTNTLSGGDHSVSLDTIFNDDSGGLKAIVDPDSGLPFLSNILTGGSDTVFDKLSQIFDLFINMNSDAWDELLSMVGTKILDTIMSKTSQSTLDKQWIYKLLQVITILLNTFSVEFY